jgi:predicted acyltransferase
VPPREGFLSSTTHAPTTPDSAEASANSGRIISLDVFRGMTIASMILVNDPGTWGAIYWPLDHAEWNGWTPTDLIFPFFIFIAGVSMTLSFAARLKRGGTRGSLALHVVIRSVAIFAVGLFLNGFPHFHFATIRYTGVLQRIAVCYLLAGLLVVATARRADREDFVANVQAIFWTMIALLVGYWALMRFVPVPGYGVGNLTPEGNLAAWIDRRIMLGHLWKPMWDPEGFLSTLPAIGTALSGVLVGEWLRKDATKERKLAGLVIAGAIAMIIGRLMHGLFPINKNLWTSTYVIFTSGFAMVILALCYWLVDMRGLRRWAKPFVIFGSNAIIAFTLATFLAKISVIYQVNVDGRRMTWHGYVYSHFFMNLASPKNASLLFALFFVIICFLPLWLLYWRRIFIKL